MANHVQIGQRTGHEQSIGILHEPAIAHFGETEDALDDQERMLDFGSHPRLRGVLRLLGRREWVVSRGLVVGKVQSLGCLLLDDLGLTGVRRVAPTRGSPRRAADVARLGCRARWRR